MDGFFIPEQIQRAIFPIHHFFLYLKYIFLHRKSIQPNLNTLENKIITPFSIGFMFSQCTNLKF